MKVVTKRSNIVIVEVSVKDFKIVLVDTYKKNSPKNSCNAGFFGNYQEDGSSFTLPVGHLVCDYDASSSYTKKYCTERGKFNGKKFVFDSGSFPYRNVFCEKSQSTLCISKNVANITETKHVSNSCDYAIAGVPIIRNGMDVTFSTFVKAQGWDNSTLYATWHTFVGIKENNAKNIYAIGMKTTTSNMITSAEAFRQLSVFGFKDVIKLDGGGSFYFNADGSIESTVGNRRINTIITFGPTEVNTPVVNNINKKNPYPVPNVTLKYGNPNKEYNKWLQWELIAHGYKCIVDGSFGPTTLNQLKAFQRANGLMPDGYCGPATIKALNT